MWDYFARPEEVWHRTIYENMLSDLSSFFFSFSFSLESWDIFFRNVNAGARPGAAYQSPPPISGTSQGLASVQALVGAQPNVEKLVKDHLAVQSLIRAYQVNFTCYLGHLRAAVVEGVEWSSSNLKIGSSIPQSSQKNLHAEESLSKMLNPKLCLIE